MEVRVMREEGEAASEEMYRETVLALPHGEATRHLINVVVHGGERMNTVTVLWTNIDRFHSRKLVYSIEVLQVCQE